MRMAEEVTQRRVPTIHKRKEIVHDETPAIITDHKFEPMGEWWTRCKHCRLAEAAHAETILHYYSDDAVET
jgi:hypothetical protein